MRPEMRVIGHVRHQTIRWRILRVTRHKLFLILLLKEIKNAGTIAHNFQIGLIHRQLSESQNTAAVIEVRRRAEWRLEFGWVAPRIEELHYLPAHDLDTSATPINWRRQRE